MFDDRKEARLARARRLRVWRHLLWGLGVATALLPFALYHFLAARLAMPGLLDPLYYHHVAEALESGRGLEIRYLWNYQERPPALAHPSNAYWGPATSFLMALGHAHPGTRPWPPRLLWVIAGLAFLAAARKAGRWREPSCLAALALPFAGALALQTTFGDTRPLHAHVEAILAAAGGVCFAAFAIGWTVARSRPVALLAPLLLVLSYPFTYFSVTTDSPVPFALFVNAALLLAVAPGAAAAALSGVGCALAALTRADGIFLLAIPAYWFWTEKSRRIRIAPLAAGFLVTMAPWWARNVRDLGTPAPASLKAALAMLDYNELFLWGPAAGAGSASLASVAATKLDALVSNAGTLMMGDSLVLWLFVPLGLLRCWQLGSARPFAAFAVMELLVLSFCFSFQSKNGSFLHSMIAVYPFAFACAAAGLLSLRRRAGLLVPLAVVLLLASGWWRSTAGDTTLPALLEDTEDVFSRFALWADQKMAADEPLLTNMPFETWHFARRPCAIVPRDEDLGAVARAARHYGIRRVVIFDNPKYLRHPFAGQEVRLGTEGRLVLEAKIALTKGPAGFGEIRIYELR